MYNDRTGSELTYIAWYRCVCMLTECAVSLCVRNSVVTSSEFKTFPCVVNFAPLFKTFSHDVKFAIQP